MIPMKHLVTLFLPAALWAQSQPVTQPVTRPVRLERIVPATSTRHLSEQGIRHHLEYLAGDGMAGREAGSTEANEAAKYIAERFREAALTPMGEHNGSERTPYQDFSVSMGRRVRGENMVTVRSPRKTATFTLEGREMVPLAYTGAGSAYGTLAFAGYGIVDAESKHDDYEGIDARGKVVLALRGVPTGSKLNGEIQKKIYTARDKGAVGFLLLELPEEDRLVPDNLPPFRSTKYDAGIPAAAVRYWVLRTAIPDLFAVAGKVRASGKPAPLVFEDVAARVKVDTVEERGGARNVMALLQGADPALYNEIVVIGAHYDHLGRGIDGAINPDDAGQVHNGADDNASGTSVLLALAPALSAERSRLRRSILFIAFSGEEKGLLGSRFFLENPTVAKDRIVAMLNLDMVGRSKDGTVLAIGSGTSPDWPGLLAAISADKIKPSEQSFGGSDHQSFIAAGIPAVHFFTGVHEDYHKPGDDVDKIDFAGTLDVARFVFDAAAHLSVTTDRPGFIAPPPPRPMSSPAGRGGRPWLGTVPDYAGGEEGVKLEGVTKGSPAEKCGMLKGDIMVGLAGDKVRNIEDFMHTLSKHKPGDEIVVVVKRDGKEIELKATLATRGQ
jgi:aminopeptidase YwaD